MPVVTATATFVGKQTDAAKRTERAMQGAALQADAEGITDPDAIRERILAARDAVKDRD